MGTVKSSEDEGLVIDQLTPYESVKNLLDGYRSPDARFQALNHELLKLTEKDYHADMIIFYGTTLLNLFLNKNYNAKLKRDQWQQLLWIIIGKDYAFQIKEGKSTKELTLVKQGYFDLFRFANISVDRINQICNTVIAPETLNRLTVVVDVVEESRKTALSSTGVPEKDKAQLTDMVRKGGISATEAKKLQQKIDTLKLIDFELIKRIINTKSLSNRQDIKDEEYYKELGIDKAKVTALSNMITASSTLTSDIIQSAIFKNSTDERLKKIEKTLAELIKPKATSDIFLDVVFAMILPGFFVGSLGAIASNYIKGTSLFKKLTLKNVEITNSFIGGRFKTEVIENFYEPLVKASEAGIKDCITSGSRELIKLLGMKSDEFLEGTDPETVITNTLDNDFKGVSKLIEAFAIAGFYQNAELDYSHNYFKDRNHSIGTDRVTYENIIIGEKIKLPLQLYIAVHNYVYDYTAGYGIGYMNPIAIYLIEYYIPEVMNFIRKIAEEEKVTDKLGDKYIDLRNLLIHTSEGGRFSDKIIDFLIGDIRSYRGVSSLRLKFKIYQVTGKDHGIFLDSYLTQVNEKNGEFATRKSYFLTYVSHIFGKNMLTLSGDKTDNTFFNKSIADQSFPQYKLERDLAMII